MVATVVSKITIAITIVNINMIMIMIVIIIIKIRRATKNNNNNKEHNYTFNVNKMRVIFSLITDELGLALLCALRKQTTLCIPFYWRGKKQLNNNKVICHNIFPQEKSF